MLLAWASLGNFPARARLFGCSEYVHSQATGRSIPPGGSCDCLSDFDDDETLRSERFNFARRRAPKRHRLPFREIDFGIAQRQHLAWVCDITLTISVAELGRRHVTSQMIRGAMI